MFLSAPVQDAIASEGIADCLGPSFKFKKEHQTAVGGCHVDSQCWCRKQSPARESAQLAGHTRLGATHLNIRLIAFL